MIKKALLTMGALVLCSTVGTSIVSAEQHLTNEQIENHVAGLRDDQYVLPVREGGYIIKADGSNNFSEEQIRIDGNPITVAQYKEYLRNVDLDAVEPTSSDFPPTIESRASHAPGYGWGDVKVLEPNDSYLSLEFNGKGWRYGGLRFMPKQGTGDYLFWQAFKDSGFAEDGAGTSVTIPGNGSAVSVYSRHGTYFKTYNPVPGSQYRVSNPV